MLDSNFFSPVESITVSASTATAAGSFKTTGIDAANMRVSNPTSAVAFVRWGSGAQTAVATDTPVLAGQSVMLPKGVGIANVAVILSTGTGSIYFTACNG